MMIENSNPALYQEQNRIPDFWYFHDACRSIEKILKDMGANIRWRALEMPFILGFRIEKDGYRTILPNRLKRIDWFEPGVYDRLVEEWRPALRGLDTKVISTVDMTSIEMPGSPSPVTEGMPPSVPVQPIEKSPGYLARRFEVFRRDGYRCQICGKAAVDGPHVRLELEHKIPRAKGGTDDLSNLWTCCWECNHGKHTKDLTLQPTSLLGLYSSEWKAIEAGYVPIPEPEEPA
jgi:hypothetical protein